MHLATPSARRSSRSSGRRTRAATRRAACATVVRIDLPCSPCNRIRLPPARCVGHTPDCLAGVEVARVLAAIDETLPASTGSAPMITHSTSSPAPGRDGSTSAPTSTRRRGTRARRRLCLDQGGASHARRRRAVPPAVHLSRRLALVVRRAVPAQGAGDPARAAHDRGVRRARRARAPAGGALRGGDPSGRDRRRRRPRARSATAAAAGRDRRAWRLARMDARASGLAAGARLSRLRAAPRAAVARARSRRSSIRAFWRRRRRRQRRVVHRPGAVRARTRVAPGAIRYVGIGAATNFRARRWWDPLVVARPG